MTGSARCVEGGGRTHVRADDGERASRAWSTGYPDVDAVLERLLAEARGALGEQFVGMVLHGSLAAGGFEPGRSDVDVVAVTEGELGALRTLVEYQRPILLTLNKSDRYSRDEVALLRESLQEHARNLVIPENIVAISADPAEKT